MPPRSSLINRISACLVKPVPCSCDLGGGGLIGRLGYFHYFGGTVRVPNSRGDVVVNGLEEALMTLLEVHYGNDPIRSMYKMSNGRNFQLVFEANKE